MTCVWRHPSSSDHIKRLRQTNDEWRCRAPTRDRWTSASIAPWTRGTMTGSGSKASPSAACCRWARLADLQLMMQCLSDTVHCKVAMQRHDRPTCAGATGLELEPPRTGLHRDLLVCVFAVIAAAIVVFKANACGRIWTWQMRRERRSCRHSTLTRADREWHATVGNTQRSSVRFPRC